MRHLFTILFFLAINWGFSQDYKFGKVSVLELQEKYNPQDSSANATVLFRKEKTRMEISPNDGFSQVTEVHQRIKFYNKDGYDWATKQIRLINGSGIALIGLKGVTYNLVNGEIEKTILKKDGIFEEKSSDFSTTTRFTMPNIDEGSIIEFKYRIESRNPIMRDKYLQYDIPIKKSEISYRIPEYFVFNKLVNPKADYIPVLKETRGVKHGHHENITTVNDENIPALKQEVYVDNINNYRSKLIWEFAAIVNPRGGSKYFSTTWEEVTKTINNSERFGSQLEKQNYFKKDIDLLVAAIDDPMEKAIAIYNFVKNRVTWNDYIGYSCSKGVKEAYKERTGNVAEMNLMLVSMLRYAGLNANPIVLSTRNNGIPVTPSTEGFNYVIAAIEVPNDIILLDATNTYGTFNQLPEYALNWRGRIIRGHGSSTWIDIAPKGKSRSNIMMSVEIDEQLDIHGKFREQKTNYFALKFRDNYFEQLEENRISELEAEKGDIEITNFKVQKIEELPKPVLYSYDFKLSNAVEDIGGKLYLSPLLFLAAQENMFKQESRIYPIDFIYPKGSKYMVNIQIPEGYEVEALPKNIKIDLNGGDGAFSYVVRQKANTINIILNSEINKTYILPANYQGFKEFFGLTFDKENEKIVLRKISK